VRREIGERGASPSWTASVKSWESRRWRTQTVDGAYSTWRATIQTSSEYSPTRPPSVRLAGSVLIEQHDEWEAGDRRYFSENFMLELAAMNTPAQTIEEVNIIPELTAA
jgi:hypothetical protein